MDDWLVVEVRWMIDWLVGGGGGEVDDWLVVKNDGVCVVIIMICGDGGSVGCGVM